MDHVVYVDAKDGELEKILDGSKTMLIRGATGRKLPHGRVNTGDMLYFIRNNGEGMILARARVSSATSTEKLEEAASKQMVSQNQPRLQLGAAQVKRWAGKRYLVLVEIDAVERLEPFAIDRSAYGNMDDWLPVEEIDSVKRVG